ncbi:carbohydrate ABC transporter permease [Priestia koreensis]|uniref:carbohydrate ABC transporter permease n=1 Tax=Priestia koreensis TaxID=284581 RepID=UPI001F59B759|nr:sugar ABC transporter permease [Priestia koreensis]MCM3006017.1 sugar ABC transporter permease [Priestia koreensis]UNL85358.1 sugar ABC transporter permease [Priestia koreensis]
MIDHAPKKSPVLPGVASAIIWGLGQLLNKQPVKALFFFIIQVLIVMIEFLTGNYTNMSGGFSFRENGGFFLKGFWGLVTLGEVPRKMSILGLTDGDHSIVLLINGIIAILFMCILLSLYYWNIKDAVKTRKLANETGHTPKTREYLSELWTSMFEYIVLIPSALLLLFISVMPIIFGVLIAFTNYNGAHLPPAKLVDWVGFDNFVNLFKMPIWSSTFLGVFGWTIVWAILSTVTCFFGGLFQAVILNNKRVKGKKFWRTLYILPWAIPGMISLLVFKTLFNGQFGPVSQFLLDIGLTSERISWFTDSSNPNLARAMVLIINLWLGFPYFMALMTGVMTSLDKEIYEAAKIDGATPTQEFWKITFPLVLSATAPLLIMSFATNFNNFNVIYFLTEGGPVNSQYQFAGYTDILITWIYKLTIDVKMYSMASVMSMIIFIVIGSISAWNFSRTQAFKEEELS